MTTDPHLIGLPARFFARDPVVVASDLIGAALLVGGVGGLIVETEAYRRDDEASHSFSGPTPRSAAMFGEPAHLYVYRSYGLHWCLNLVCEAGSAVLVRALEPIYGLDRMIERRGIADRRRLCRGPGNVSQALGVTGAMNGLCFSEGAVALYRATLSPVVASGPRIGISKAVDKPWRFVLQGSPFVSSARSSPQVTSPRGLSTDITEL